MILKVFENEDVNIKHCGSSEERESFYVSNKDVIDLRENCVRFKQPGVYQIGSSSSTVLVLPGFLKDNEQALSNSSSSIRSWFEMISAFSNSLNDTLAISDLKKNDSGWEPLVFSILTIADDLTLAELDREVFQSETNVRSSIRGKWNIRRDIKRGVKPLKFTCTNPVVKADSPLLRVLKSVLITLKGYVSSQSNINLIDSMLGNLSEIQSGTICEQSFLEAREFVSVNEISHHWAALIDFFEGLTLRSEHSLKSSGLSFRLPMDTFFEEFVAGIFSGLGYRISKQYSVDVLGGAEWIGKDGKPIGSGRIKSRPDLLVESEDDLMVVEVKYKPFTLPPQRRSDGSHKGFGRGDRNQVLSFMLSYLDIQTTKKPRFIVVYPQRDDRNSKYCALRFPKTSIDFANEHLELVVGTNMQESNALQIEFLGLNILDGLSWVSKANEHFEESLLMALGLQSNQPEAA